MFKTPTTLFNSYEKRKIITIKTIPKNYQTMSVYEGQFIITFSDYATMKFSTYLGRRKEIKSYCNVLYSKDDKTKKYSYSKMNSKLYNKIINF